MALTMLAEVEFSMFYDVGGSLVFDFVFLNDAACGVS